MIWHSADINEVKSEFSVDEKVGLSSAEIAGRIAKYGENKQQSSDTKASFKENIIKRVTGGLQVFFLIVALVTMVVNIVSSSGLWHIPLIAILLFGVNIGVDILLIKKLEKDTAGLKGNIELSVEVLRDGEEKTIPASLLVPGDVVLLKEGDFISADGRLIESYSLTCEESAVLGNSAPNEKRADVTLEDIAEIQDRKNMVYAGCSVVFGHGKMIVTDTGANTEVSRKAAITQMVEHNETTLKKQLAKIGGMIRVGLLIVSLVIFILGVIGESSTENFSTMVVGMLLTATSVAVGIIPVAIPLIPELALAFGADRLTKGKVSVRNIDAIEKLGQVSVIISDKTGTLTKNRMKMTMLYDGNNLCELNLENPNENAITLIRTAALCTNSNLEISAKGKQNGVGDPTEVGILSALMEYSGLGKDEIENIYPRMAEVPFDSQRKLMTTINMINNRPFAIVKGSPDMLITHCVSGNIEGAKKATEEMSKRGLRAIAVAIKPLDEVPANPNPENMECDLNFLGMFGMTDTISRQTTEAIKESRLGGVRTIMITGDNITAAEAIARNLGILTDGQRAVTGLDVENMDDATLSNEIYNISVYSRLSVKDKIRVIEAFKAKGEIVTVTGDSIEDAEVLKVADVGCAMGITGTDIAKSSADLVLREDSYISIVRAIKESRGIYGNIKKSLSFVLSSAIGQLLVMLSLLIFAGKTLMSAPGVLWLNIILGFGLAIGLASRTASTSDMLNPAPTKKEALFKGDYGISVLWQGGLIAVLGIVAYIIGGSGIAFATLAFALSVLALSLSTNNSIIKEKALNNKYLLYAVCFALISVILIFATPVYTVFGLTEIGAGGFFLSLLFGIIPLITSEVVKFVKKYSSENKGSL